MAEHLDAVLRTAEVPDYPGAMNGIQVEHLGPVTRCAVAVDASMRTIEGAVAAGANLLLVHHGLFWSGVQPLRGRFYERVRRLVQHDLAVYSSHLPLDLHPTLGNNALFARALGLEPTAPFARFQHISVGVMGDADVDTATLADRARAVAEREGGALVAVGMAAGRRTRRWALCTGAGASSDTLREAAAAGVDTLIVGEGPHHTGVEAQELDIAVLYAGHYATETFGVRALGAELERTFGLPWSFVAAPTGL
ncbi:MAG: Nif3-like dinuclear metal center hexameric protein [Gemmatimonadaceae bacterium]|nr:Nif3-like dinuclear metal center hexameric protein [Gemmatimonadaceae bacterium]NUO94999.1 Nif3-like dinuclear metal center hexameric protein [Gemmatimonadaceae bacterium]NUP71297.1 Nif3-like dinuclear metal center hexameric protein [Gemmatimonadaceae bacterium]NUR33957.1 Nif3-like dinuclear metal center hexameric protein [Gemmatimonadaceae bacterium]NUS34141.1 Nif3-like dinuclear metal center hexameric protein [Gemmatimonadaceae bacterium]